jgi:formylglycine-generating enzyme required for sulfatase activity
MRRTSIAIGVLALGCGKSRAVESALLPAQTAMVSTSTATLPGTPRAGMVWVNGGVLRAGSGLEEVPRVADAELPGTEIPLGGFYVDILPWPNEPGAIPTTDVSRDEAKRLCESKAKRLCSELEWERACKGPDSTLYEYGSTYDARTCGAGAAALASSMRPSGQRPACRSALGVRDLHGGPSEWTDSRWGRGGPKDMGVVRGGNDLAGELVTRCAFARALTPSERSATTGFRCCAGPRNEAEVDLPVKKGPLFERAPPELDVGSPPIEALGGAACGPSRSPGPCSISRAWAWRPAPNVELALSGGCVGRDPSAKCAVAVSRAVDGQVQTLAQIDTGLEIPEVVLVESADHRVRVRGANLHGQFFREVVFDYGRVDVKPVR